jgi:hypothetical protein
LNKRKAERENFYKRKDGENVPMENPKDDLLVFIIPYNVLIVYCDVL